MTFVDLRSRRRALRRTIKQQAHACGVNASTVSRLEGGKQLPHLKNLKRIAEAYGVSELDVVASVIAIYANRTPMNAPDHPPEVCISRNIAQQSTQSDAALVGGAAQLTVRLNASAWLDTVNQVANLNSRQLADQAC